MSGATLPVDESCLGPRDIGEARDAERIAGRHDQALGTAGEADAGAGTRGLSHGSYFGNIVLSERAFRQMEARDLALRLAQRDHAFEAADEAHVELRPRPRAQQVPQFGEHEVVARIDAEGRVRLVEDGAELLLDLGRGAFEVRREPRIDPLAHPRSRSPSAVSWVPRPCSLVTRGCPIRSDQVVIRPQACR